MPSEPSRTVSRRAVLGTLAATSLAGCQRFERFTTPWRFKTGPASWAPGSHEIPPDTWPMERHDAQQSAAAPRTTGPDPPLEPHWTTPVSDSWLHSPVVAEGRIFTGTVSTPPHVVALDAETGERLWRYETEHALSGSPAIADGTVYVHENFRWEDPPDVVRALDAATGTLQWTYELDNTDGGGGVVFAAGRTVYLTPANRLVALDATTGELAWEFTPGSKHRRVASVALGPEAVYTTAHDAARDAYDAGEGDGTVFALDPAEEAVRWTADLVQPTDIATSEDRLLVRDLNTLHAFERSTGDRHWRVPLRQSVPIDHGITPRSQFVVADGTVYHQTDATGGGGAAIAAVSLADGSEQARFELGYPGSTETFPRLALAGDRLYTFTTADESDDAWLDVIDVADGTLLTTPGTGGDRPPLDDAAPPAVADGSLFLGDGEGAIHALR